MDCSTILRRLAPIALVCAILVATGCGGGGGGDDNAGNNNNDDDNNNNGGNQVASNVAIVSTPELDGVVRADGVSNEGRSDIQPAVGDGPFVIGSGSNVFQAYYSFDLSTLPPGAQITSANMSLFNRDTFGAPTAAMVLIRVDHVNFGTIFPQAPLGGTTLEFDFAQIADPDLEGRKNIDVAAQVQADLDAGRTRSQFRLRGAIASNNDNIADVALLTDGEDSQGSGELPLLELDFTFIQP